MDERRWPGGFYHVAVNTDHNPSHRVKHIKSHRRPFHRLTFQVDEYATPPALYDGLRAHLQGAGLEQTDLAPVIEVRLEGVLSFSRSDLDREHVRQIANETLSPLIVLVKNNTRATEFEIAPAASLNRAELERSVLRDLIRRDARRRGQADQWAVVAIEVKRMALDDSDPESIAATVRQRLTELVQE